MRRLIQPRRLTTRQMALGLVAAVAMAGCSGSSADTGPVVTTIPALTTVESTAPVTASTVTSTTTTSITAPPTTEVPTTTTLPPEEAAAREAAEMFVPATDAAWGIVPVGTPNAQHPELLRWVAPPVLDNIQRTLETAAELGRYSEGESTFEILGDLRAQGDGSFWAAFCLFEDNAVFEADGTVQSPPATEPQLYRLVLVETEAGWATSEFIRIDGETCEL